MAIVIIFFTSKFFYLNFVNANLFNEIFYRSFEQQHNYNYPYQIGNKSDDPNDAIDIVHRIRDKDIIVMGSDGLFDNLFDHEI
jgi:hypothetical protein